RAEGPEPALEPVRRALELGRVGARDRTADRVEQGTAVPDEDLRDLREKLRVPLRAREDRLAVQDAPRLSRPDRGGAPPRTRRNQMIERLEEPARRDRLLW